MSTPSGYFRAGTIAGVPIFLHWSLPIGPFVLSGLRFAPGLYFGILGIVLVHELGHAAVAKVRGCTPQAIRMHALGGSCQSQIKTELDGISIAWGGVLAQLWLYLIVAILALFYVPETRAMADLHHALTRTNLVVAAMNLIPIAPLDGAEAWRIFGALGWFRRGARVAPLSALDDPGTERLGALDDAEADAARTVREALERAREDARASRDSVK